MVTTLDTFVFDLHSDVVSDIALRRGKGERRVLAARHLPSWIKGGIGAAIVVLWVEPDHRRRPVERLLELLGALLADLAETPEATLATGTNEILSAVEANKVALVLGAEGLSFLESWPTSAEPDSAVSAVREEKTRQGLATLSNCGLRHAILAWNETNGFASATEPGGSDVRTSFHPLQPPGLTAAGRHLIQQFSRLGIAVDLSHLDEPSFWEVLASYPGPPLASHSNARALCDVSRNLNDAQLKAIARQNGVIGLNSWPSFVHPTDPSLDRFVDHAVYIADLVGVEHLALGFDFTGYLPRSLTAHLAEAGSKVTPGGLTGPEQVSLLLEALIRRGFSSKEITAIAHGNGLRVLEAAWFADKNQLRA